MLPVIIINRLSDLPSAAKEVLKLCGDNKLIALYGSMGAGKTTLIKQLCIELGVKDNISSPTFSLVNEYTTTAGDKVFHFDLYRIRSVFEVYDMGYEDYFFSGHYCFIEWPEKIEELLPSEMIKLKIEVDKDKRTVSLINK